VFYFGIVDVLQPYTLKKQLEHSIKSLVQVRVYHVGLQACEQIQLQDLLGPTRRLHSRVYDALAYAKEVLLCKRSAKLLRKPSYSSRAET
jgi:hypothetical protein